VQILNILSRRVLKFLNMSRLVRDQNFQFQTNWMEVFFFKMDSFERLSMFVAGKAII
jgi:hypothetical protein